MSALFLLFMKTLLIVSFILFGIFTISQVALTYSSESIEHPDYKILKRFDAFEIRYYPELIVASTKIANDSYENSSSAGFRTIASYIFGGNEENTKISMTSPVRMELNDTVEMSFYMPSDHTLSNLPKPNNSDVVLTSKKPQVVAAIEFSGWANNEKIEKAFNKLKNLLEEKKIRYINECTYLGYNPPYQMVKRKNEIIIELIDVPHE